MTKSEIIKRTGCLRHIFLSLCMAAVGLCATIYCFKIIETAQSVRVIAGVFFAIMFFISATLTIKEIPVLSMIIRGKYEIKNCRLLAIKFRHPYQAGNDTQRSLEFAKFKLTVDKLKAEEFNRGDMITMVFLQNVKYPILIQKSSTKEE